MKFIEMCPSTWEELQDLVAQLLNQAGYHAVSPCTIDTVRGTVEVDVFVESPDVFVKTLCSKEDFCFSKNYPTLRIPHFAFRI